MAIVGFQDIDFKYSGDDKPANSAKGIKYFESHFSAALERNPILPAVIELKDKPIRQNYRKMKNHLGKTLVIPRERPLSLIN